MANNERKKELETVLLETEKEIEKMELANELFSRNDFKKIIEEGYVNNIIVKIPEYIANTQGERRQSFIEKLGGAYELKRYIEQHRENIEQLRLDKDEILKELEQD